MPHSALSRAQRLDRLRELLESKDPYFNPDRFARSTGAATDAEIDQALADWEQREAPRPRERCPQQVAALQAVQQRAGWFDESLDDVEEALRERGLEIAEDGLVEAERISPVINLLVGG